MSACYGGPISDTEENIKSRNYFLIRNYELKIHIAQPSLVNFDSDFADETVCYQMVICYPNSPN